MSRERWGCADCDGDGMFETATGQQICHCKAGQKRRAYLEMTNKQRRDARRRKPAKPATDEPDAQEEIPF